ncbi:hypothetical protein GGG16DRAFT_119353 [Schizophyllum commune]
MVNEDILVAVHEDEGLGKGTRADGTEYILRRLHVFDETAGPVTLTLWGSATDFIFPTGSICAIKSVKVGRFRNVTSVSSTALTSSSIEPDTTYAKSLRLWYTEHRTTLRKVAAHKLSPLHLTIGEVLERAVQASTTATDRPLRFLATILQVDCQRYGYFQCDLPHCRKKVQRQETGYVCNGCSNVIKNPQFAYMLHLTVADPSGSLHLVAFSNVAERLVGIPPAQVGAILASYLTSAHQTSSLLVPSAQDRQEELKLLSALEETRGRQYWMICIARLRQQTNGQPNAVLQYHLSNFSEPDYHDEIEHARQSLQAALSEGLI